VIMWRTPELGYALVSDVDARDLNALACSFELPNPESLSVNDWFPPYV